VITLEDALSKYWGYTSFRPLQREAMAAILDGRDSVVVLPTGGGKSLCFQAPALVRGGLGLVISPLISLMKDQVDTLVQNGIDAACYNSSLAPDRKAAVVAGIREGRYSLLYVSPERLAGEGSAAFLQMVGRVSYIAIDEAHCISQWGHDFRPEYRQLRILKELFAETAVHAYTATATPQVRADIVKELRLANPLVLVGHVDRPNLVYRVQPRTDRLRQVLAAIDRHRSQAGIVYCIRRSEVDDVSAALVRRGLKAVPYHAGLADAERRRNQDAFVNERADVVVATVAFGMGIDRSNVRYVIHAGMPKSIEHYQQEAGRAGRDGLEAECLLLWSGADYGLWKSVLESEGPAAPGALRKLGEIFAFCQDAVCRHCALVTYFGQEPPAGPCGACDVCLGEVTAADDSGGAALQILACVDELRGRFGAGHIADVLTGASTDRLRAMRHDRLAAYGALRDIGKQAVRGWIEQMLAQGQLSRSDDEYPTLIVTETGRQAVRGEVPPPPLRSLRRASARPRPVPAAAASGESERDLFEALRVVRRQLAQERGVPPYVIFSDASLRDMARLRPTTPGTFLAVKGVGEWKCNEFGEPFMTAIRAHPGGVRGK